MNNNENSKKTNLHNPHDKIVKSSLSNKLIAKDFLQKHLPESISIKIDWNTLQQIEASTIANFKLFKILLSQEVYCIQNKLQRNSCIPK